MMFDERKYIRMKTQPISRINILIISTLTVCIATSWAGKILENSNLSLTIDDKTGAIICMENKLTSEVYTINGDQFAIKAFKWSVNFPDFKLVSLTEQPGQVSINYEHPKVDIKVAYSLGQGQAFVQKKLQMVFKEACSLKQVTVSEPVFSAKELQTVCYRYLDFEIIDTPTPGYQHQ